jgi:SAM-dependent methyltransferase
MRAAAMPGDRALVRRRLMPGYLLSEADLAQRARLDSIAAPADVCTKRILHECGVREGWHCAEIGAGSGTIAAWLCSQVGATGSVVGTDINTRWLESLSFANLDVKNHDIAATPLDGHYDLVHARNVLCHVGDREQAFAHLVQAVRPGGWLVVEDIDFIGAGTCYPVVEAFERFNAATTTLMERAGADPYFGRKLPSWVDQAGLDKVGWDVRHVPTDDEAVQRNVEAIAPAAIAADLVTQEDVETLAAQPLPLLRYGPRFVAAWGMKPSTHKASAASA